MKYLGLLLIMSIFMSCKSSNDLEGLYYKSEVYRSRFYTISFPTSKKGVISNGHGEKDVHFIYDYKYPELTLWKPDKN